MPFQLDVNLRTMLSLSLRQQIQAHFPDQSMFLIALSGGVDSVVLLHLFSQLARENGVTVRAVHIHHGLSPNADDWVAFCEQLCEQWNVPLSVRYVQVAKTGNVEAEARSARYQAIGEVIFPHEVLVTAHHLDDQAETFFLALKRGSGMKGLSAMQAVSFWQNFTIFRPLLAHRKAEILAYAKQHDLNWIEDESNQNSDFDRNFLRNEVLPLFNQRWHHFNQMVARASQYCNESQQLLEELLADDLQRYADFQRRSLNIAEFHRFSLQKQQQLLRLWLEKCQLSMPTQTQLAELLKMAQAERDKNPHLKLGQWVIRRYQQHFFITPEFADTRHFSENLSLNQWVSLPDGIGEVCRMEREVICKFPHKTARLPLPEVLWCEPLQLKLHHSGKVSRFGKPLREDIKKIWQQHQIPTWERNRTPLIFWQEKLIGLIGRN